MSKNFSAIKNVKSIVAMALCVSATSFFAACGDDSSTSPAQPSPAEPTLSSSSEGVPPVSNGEVTGGEINTEISSSSEAVQGDGPQVGDVVPPVSGEVSGAIVFDPTVTGLVLSTDEDGFYDMADVYKAVPATSKVAFVIRHSKRQKSTGTESLLTPIGIQMATTLGERIGGDEPFYYASTDFIRTRTTCEYIAQGRGETAEVVTWDGINGGYFLTVPSDTLDAAVSRSGGNPKFIAKYAYGVPFTSTLEQKVEPYFYPDMIARANQFVNEVIVANMPAWNRVSILASHDMLVEPLIAYASNRTINLKVYEAPFRWVNYLSGVAVIVDANGVITVLPTKGDTVGWMIPSKEIAE